MSDPGQHSVRRTFAVVDNVVESRLSLDSEGRSSLDRSKGLETWPTSSSISSEPSQTVRSLPASVSFSPARGDSHSDGLRSSQSVASASSLASPVSRRPSSVASSSGSAGVLPSRSSNSNISASLLTPTLASALGIIPSARRRRHAARRNTAIQAAAPLSTSATTSTTIGQILPGWTRRPSLPSISNSSKENRISTYSVASFESLPEGEVVENPTGSPRSHPQAESMSPTTTQPAARMLSPSIWTKRRNVALELLETEKAFVASLRIVNEHYYQPLVALSRGRPCQQQARHVCSAAPVLSRKAISEIFSNFSDILHLNTELLSRLEERLSGRSRDPPNSRPVSFVVLQRKPEDGESSQQAIKHQPWDAQTDLIGDLLAPMAPFLKMYSLYVKNFSSALNRIEIERKANDSFARFLKETERLTWMTSSTTGRPGGFGFGLGLQAHLLTVVQRIPRYKLLVGELIACTPPQHKDRADLARAYHVIEQVAESINENIRQHEMVLEMLDIQRSLIGLTIPLIVPGRTLLKRATMLKAGRKDIHAREFFLFSDCIMYAAPVGGAMTDASAAWHAFSRYGTGAGVTDTGSNSPVSSPSIVRYAQAPVRSFSPDKRPDVVRRRTTSVPTRVDPKRLSLSAYEGQQLQFRGKFALQDCTVVGVENATSHDPALRHYIEIRTPGKSFAVYAESFDAKQDWLSAIRSAREELMSNRRTLHAEEDSIAAKRDRRRSLQAIGRHVSFPRTSDTSPSAIPEGASVHEFSDTRARRESLPSFSTSASLASYLGAATLGSIATDANSAAVRGGLKVLEEYNAPVWVPDNRADKCACCSEAFGLWRRKHHCRLCGQVVCWACSQRNFLIASYEEGEQDRPARACDPCYESVFPDTGSEVMQPPDNSATPPLANATDPRSSQVIDSDVSISSTPPTPTSPHEPGMALHDGKRTSIASLSAVDEDSEAAHGNARSGIVVLPKHEMSSSPVRQAPAARIAKAHASSAQLIHGRMLSPQVHAATSGTGTFRLVTPRLTTPEHEKPPLVRSTTSHAVNMANESQPSSSHQIAPAEAGAGADGYFAGIQPGQSELRGVQPFPFLAPRRRKLMSAAARLSSVYSAQPPQTQ